MSDIFKPAWWLPGPHCQTIWPTLARRGLTVAVTRERIELADGDFIDLDWGSQPANASQPMVLILHGLEGSTHSPYVRGMLQMIQRQGWWGVVMHFRGCSGEPNRLLRAYHSGETSDVAAITAILRARHPARPIVALGFSLGGNVLLKWLGESGSHNPLIAAVAVSVPLDLAKSAKRLQTGFSRVYQWHLLKSLRAKIRTKLHLRVTKNINAIKTLEAFDNQFTAPIHGFSNAQAYYAQSSSHAFLRTITVPTLIIQAQDDPFMTMAVLDKITALPPNVYLEVTKQGGHVGFVEGSVPWRPQYWLERRIPAFIQECLAQK